MALQYGLILVMLINQFSIGISPPKVSAGLIYKKACSGVVERATTAQFSKTDHIDEELKCTPAAY